MVDFTSALYLGRNHVTLDEPLTLGKPAALEEPPGAAALAGNLANLSGFEAALTAPSTLHLALDVAAFLAAQRAEFLVEQGAYPICRWGVEFASARGCPVQSFQHHSPESLRAVLRNARRPPVVVVDGFCPSCGTLAPLAAYQDLLRPYGGRLLIDDTQALGILGGPSRSARSGSPYGSGGGGSFAYTGIRASNAIVMSSLAKAFGAPVACLLGTADLIRNVAATSITRLHCSPPSSAAIRAGLHALDWNSRLGDPSRRRLFETVAAFRKLLLNRGWPLVPGFFPVQALKHPHAPAIHASLLKQGIRSLFQPAANGGCPRAVFSLTLAHQPEHLHRLSQALDAISVPSNIPPASTRCCRAQ